MTKQEFLFALRQRLDGLPEDDVVRSIDYYTEMIEDRMEDGLDERSAVDAIGTVEEVAEQILSEIPMTKLVKKRVKSKEGRSVLSLILIIVGSPIWASLLIVFAAVVFSLYVVIWSLVAVAWAVDASVAACGIAGIGIAGVYLFVGYPFALSLFCIGAGLLCAGLAIYLFFAGKAATRGMVKLSRSMWLGMKRLVVGKGARQ